MTVEFRPMVSEERTFVVDAWVRSYQFAHAAGMIAMERWFSIMIPEVERVLARPDARTVVAFETDVDVDERYRAELYGFITVDTEPATPVVFYVYVKEPYRKSGIARRLFAAAGVDPARPFVYTCTTGVVSAIYHSRKIPLARWSPLVARFAKDDPRRPRSSR